MSYINPKHASLQIVCNTLPSTSDKFALLETESIVEENNRSYSLSFSSISNWNDASCIHQGYFESKNLQTQPW